METADVGFPIDGLAFVETDAGLAGYAPDEAAALYETWRTRVAALPGVESATLAAGPPTGGLDGPFSTREIEVDGYTPADDEFVRGRWTWAGPGHFETLGLPPLYGRTFTEFDRPETPGVVVINEVMARRYFGTPNAVGGRFRVVARSGEAETGAGVELEVVGVVPDTRDWVLRDPLPSFYRSSSQGDGLTPTVVARTALDPVSLLPLMRQTLRDLGGELPVLRARTMPEHVAAALGQSRAAGAFLSGLGALGLGLASLGLYAVMAFGVSRQAREIGIRRALGAGRTHVVWTVSRSVATLLGVGLTIGLGLAWASVRGVGGDCDERHPHSAGHRPDDVRGRVGAPGYGRTGRGILPRPPCRQGRSTRGAASSVGRSPIRRPSASPVDGALLVHHDGQHILGEHPQRVQPTSRLGDRDFHHGLLTHQVRDARPRRIPGTMGGLASVL